MDLSRHGAYRTPQIYGHEHGENYHRCGFMLDNREHDKNQHNVGPPSNVCWFANPMNTIVRSITNHSYWSYPPTPALAKAGAAPGTTAGVELVFLSNRHPKATSMASYGRPSLPCARP